MTLALLATQAALAATPTEILAALQTEAGQGYTATATRGEAFFKKPGKEWSCATCHTDNPRNVGSHKVTGKAIKPLAPSANAERFTDRAKVDKWFRRNCNDVLGRACTPAEQADVLAYLVSLK